MIFQDKDTPYTSFVENSVYINNVLSTGSNPDTGFSVNSLNPGDITTIKYSVTIDSPALSIILNTNSSIKYSYLITSNTTPIYITEFSNNISLIVLL